jgi:hypothetical protein
MRILYPIHIQAPKKDLYPITITAKKRIWIYILYPLSKILPALSQFLKNKKPDQVALQHISPRLFTGSNINPDLSAAQQGNGKNGSAKGKILPLKLKISGTEH